MNDEKCNCWPIRNNMSASHLKRALLCSHQSYMTNSPTLHCLCNVSIERAESKWLRSRTRSKIHISYSWHKVLWAVPIFCTEKSTVSTIFSTGGNPPLCHLILYTGIFPLPIHVQNCIYKFPWCLCMECTRWGLSISICNLREKEIEGKEMVGFNFPINLRPHS